MREESPRRLPESDARRVISARAFGRRGARARSALTIQHHRIRPPRAVVVAAAGAEDAPRTTPGEQVLAEQVEVGTFSRAYRGRFDAFEDWRGGGVGERVAHGATPADTCEELCTDESRSDAARGASRRDGMGTHISGVRFARLRCVRGARRRCARSARPGQHRPPRHSRLHAVVV